MRTDAVIFVDADGNDVAYIRGVMEQDGITVTEELVVENDETVRRQRWAETDDGERLVHVERHRN